MCGGNILANNKFRSAMFGFNKDDVMLYIKSSAEKHLAKTNELQSQLLENASTINLLNTTVAELKEKVSELEKTNLSLSDKVDEYRSREDTITKLSEGIGKLYLVAQTNAKVIVEDAKKNIEISSRQVNNNLNVIESAQDDLSDFRAKLSELTESYNAKISELISELEIAKAQINANNNHIEAAKNTALSAVNIK